MVDYGRYANLISSFFPHTVKFNRVMQAVWLHVNIIHNNNIGAFGPKWWDYECNKPPMIHNNAVT